MNKSAFSKVFITAIVTSLALSEPLEITATPAQAHKATMPTATTSRSTVVKAARTATSSTIAKSKVKTVNPLLTATKSKPTITRSITALPASNSVTVSGQTIPLSYSKSSVPANGSFNYTANPTPLPGNNKSIVGAYNYDQRTGQLKNLKVTSTAMTGQVTVVNYSIKNGRLVKTTRTSSASSPSSTQ